MEQHIDPKGLIYIIGELYYNSHQEIERLKKIIAELQKQLNTSVASS